jgi:ATP-dependent Clp protease, protease subunit
MSVALREFVLCNLHRLRLDRLLILDEPITEPVADRLITRILELEARDSTTDIVLTLNSPGGELKAGLAVYDTICYTACDVMTVCVEQAASMAALVLAAGTPGKRVALSAARVSLHAPWASPVANRTATHEAEMQRVAALVYRTLAQLTGQPLNVIEDDARLELTLNAVEARAYGFIDCVDRWPPLAIESAHADSLEVGLRATASR